MGRGETWLYAPGLSMARIACCRAHFAGLSLSLGGRACTGRRCGKLTDFENKTPAALFAPRVLKRNAGAKPLDFVQWEGLTTRATTTRTRTTTAATTTTSATGSSRAEAAQGQGAPHRMRVQRRLGLRRLLRDQIAQGFVKSRQLRRIGDVGICRRAGAATATTGTSWRSHRGTRRRSGGIRGGVLGERHRGCSHHAGCEQG